MKLEKTSIGSILQLSYGKSLPERNREYGEFPVYGSGGIGGFHNRALVKGPGVIVGRKGTVGSVYLEERDFFPIDTVYFVEPNVDRLDIRFAYYLLKNLPLSSLNSDAAVPGLNRERALSLEVNCPSLTDQKVILDVLFQYDLFIQNNNKRMALLEESARLLYREWFVHLRFPGHEHIRVTNGVPEGWERSKVGTKLLKLERKKRIKKEEYLVEGGIPCIDQSQDYIGGYTEDEESLHKEPLPIIVFGDHTRVLKFVDFPFASGADGTQLLYPNDSILSPEFLYFSLQAVDLSNYFYARHFKFLKEQVILIPSSSLMGRFTDIVAPLLKQISVLRQQNLNLAKARNILLPRLMNGEITV